MNEKMEKKINFDQFLRQLSRIKVLTVIATQYFLKNKVKTLTSGNELSSYKKEILFYLMCK